MTCKLSDICYYVNEKVEIIELDEFNYISTENMLPNKMGITIASKLPSTKFVKKYNEGDVLVSNIRPYFKKIWYATKNGGCSNDILVFRAKKGYLSKFLYYLLSTNDFFNYSTLTSKGTKMPRGDKSALMEFSINEYDIDVQYKIACILDTLSEKIQLNTKINKNLEQQVQELYKSWFVDFDPYDRVMPNDWSYSTLSSIVNITSGKRPQTKSTYQTKENPIPIVGAAAVMGYTNEANHTDKILVTGRVGTHGVIQRFNSPCWTSDNTLVISSDYYEYTSQILKHIDYSSLNRGSTQPLITQSDLKKVAIILPSNSILNEFEDIAGTLMKKYDDNLVENNKLSKLRDTLLPKLISGELDVSNIEI